MRKAYIALDRAGMLGQLDAEELTISQLAEICCLSRTQTFTVLADLAKNGKNGRIIFGRHGRETRLVWRDNNWATDTELAAIAGLTSAAANSEP